jgi:hypothetical protein
MQQAPAVFNQHLHFAFIAREQVNILACGKLILENTGWMVSFSEACSVP